MILSTIEKLVLNNIGMRYDELSVSTDPKEILDFAILHTCVNLAREEIKLNTKLPCLTMFGTAINTVAGTSGYNLPTDFDIPIAIYYWAMGNSEAALLKQYYVEGLPATVPVAIGGATLVTGTVYGYIIAGTSADLIQIYIIDVPDVAGIILPMYKPVLTELSLATAEDVLLRKYSKTVINFATAFAAQLLKKDEKIHDKFYAIGLGNCRDIDLREMKADSNYHDLPSTYLMNLRAGRLSK
jgi:hypothetical protein